MLKQTIVLILGIMISAQSAWSQGIISERSRRSVWFGTADIIQLQRSIEAQRLRRTPEQARRLREIEALPENSTERSRLLREYMAEIANNDELPSAPKPEFSIDLGTPMESRGGAVIFRFSRGF